MILHFFWNLEIIGYKLEFVVVVAHWNLSKCRTLMLEIKNFVLTMIIITRTKPKTRRSWRRKLVTETLRSKTPRRLRKQRKKLRWVFYFTSFFLSLYSYFVVFLLILGPLYQLLFHKFFFGVKGRIWSYGFLRIFIYMYDCHLWLLGLRIGSAVLELSAGARNRQESYCKNAKKSATSDSSLDSFLLINNISSIFFHFFFVFLWVF